MNSRGSRVEGREPGDRTGPRRETRSAVWPLLLLLVAAGATLLVMQMRRPAPPNPWINLPLPPLAAAGWLNTDGPLSTDDLRGQVVLVDFWTTSCHYCLVHMPELVEFHERFREQGLTIVGLTPEPLEVADRVQQVVDRAGIDWPIGYGAGFTFGAMSIRGTPTYLLYDRSGRSVWGGHSLHGLEDATLAALARE